MIRGFRRGRPSKGQALVEFALIVPVLLILLLITIDFGRAFMSYVTLTNATRVAANFGSLDPSAFTGTPPSTAAYDVVVGRETAGLNCNLQDSGGNLLPIPTITGGLGGKSVVKMTCDFLFITPLLTSFFGGPLPISASAEFPIRTGAIANIGGTPVVPPPGAPQAAFSFVNVNGGVVDASGNVTGAGQVTVNVLDSSQNAQTWVWDWGDGGATVSGPIQPLHPYASPGTYPVTLTVSNTVGTSSASHTVTVIPPASQPPPVAGFYGDLVPDSSQYRSGGGSTGAVILGNLSLSSPSLSVTFTNTSTNGSTYSWDWGDGSSTPAADTSPLLHSYTKLGVFTVTLTITTPSGATPVSRSNYVTTGCVVPVFPGNLTSAASGLWAGALFNGTITYQSSTAPGGSGKSSTPPSPAKDIVSQAGLNGGDFVPATRQNNNSPWVCAGDINLRYAP